jgi:hypothetical protein
MSNPRPVDANAGKTGERKSHDNISLNGHPAHSDLASLLKVYSVPKPDNYDWKDDYAKALDEKYARIR